MILILGSHDDPHVMAVTYFLKQYGVKYRIAQLADIPTRASVTFGFGSDASECLSVTYTDAEGAIDLATAQTIWMRRMGPLELPDDISHSEHRQFAEQEVRSAWDGIHRVLSDRRWLNPPASNSMASNKPYQLRIAQEVGLSIPRTLISNAPDDCSRFLTSSNKKHIYKPLTAFSMNTEDGYNSCIYTTIVDTESVAQHHSAISLAPCIFQEYIEKEVELRITVIGTKLFAAAIHSQANPNTSIDWRNYDLQNTPHTPYSLPPSIASKILALMGRLNLVYGAIDMIVTPSGQYVFLEINPSGQYLWIEALTDLPISEAVARWLCLDPQGPSDGI